MKPIRKVLFPSLVAALLALIAIPWDLEISHLARGLDLPGDVRKFVQLSEAFAHGATCALLLGTLLWIDIENRRKLWAASCVTLVCGVTANLAKYIVPRRRPHAIDPSSHLSVWDTWGVPWTDSWWNEEIRSFPSGHTATAIALAISLSFVYPKGRWIFGTIAGFAAFQRLFSGAHFASDILASASFTFAIASLSFLFFSRNRSETMEIAPNDSDAIDPFKRIA
jgi:membrane-associated phospholipid phosphatase